MMRRQRGDDCLHTNKSQDGTPKHLHDSSTYRNHGWISMRDWLGLSPKYRPFTKARDYVQKLRFPNQASYREWAATDSRPADIPRYPNDVYKNVGWMGWADWLGNRNFGKRNRTFRPFKKARSFARALGLKNWREWKRWAASEWRPQDIPSNPAEIYEDKGWVNVADWLGYYGRFPRARYASASRPTENTMRRRRKRDSNDKPKSDNKGALNKVPTPTKSASKKRASQPATSQTIN